MRAPSSPAAPSLVHTVALGTMGTMGPSSAHRRPAMAFAPAPADQPLSDAVLLAIGTQNRRFPMSAGLPRRRSRCEPDYAYWRRASARWGKFTQRRCQFRICRRTLAGSSPASTCAFCRQFPRRLCCRLYHLADRSGLTAARQCLYRDFSRLCGTIICALNLRLWRGLLLSTARHDRAIGFRLLVVPPATTTPGPADFR